MRCAIVALMLVVGAGVARADKVEDAKRLFDEGRALVAKDKFLEACVLFEKSYELDPAAGTKLNLAECAERDGKPRKAWVLWIEAADEFDRTSDPADRGKYARKRANQLGSKLATVAIHVAKPRKGMVVRVGDRDVTVGSEIIERVEPGSVAINVTSPSREPFTATVDAVLGKQVEVDVPVQKRIGTTEPDPDDVVAEAPSRWRTVTFVAGGVTALSFGTYLYAYTKLRALGFGDKCLVDQNGNFTPDSPADCVNGDRYKSISQISGALTLAAGVTTVISFIMWRKDGKRSKDVAILVTPRSAGLSVRW